MPVLPERPSLDHLREQAKSRKRDRAVPLATAQHELAREYGFDSWAKLVHHVEAVGLTGLERALVLADAVALATVDLVSDVPPLLVLLRRSTGTPAAVRECAGVLLDRGADPDVVGDGSSALAAAVGRGDAALVRLLLDRGATSDDDAFYHACEHGGTDLLDLLHRPGFERLVNHKLDFEDVDGLRWFLDHGVDVNAERCLHHAIGRGRGTTILTALLDAGADVDLPWDRWDVGRRPLALAARCGHLAAYDLLLARGAVADLDPVDRAVLAVARGESVELPRAVSPVLGTPEGDDFGWILGQFAVLGRTDVVAALLDAGMAVDTRGWSGFTPLYQAAMQRRTAVVRLLVERGADLADRAFDEDGPTPLDCALWGLRNNRADDGDYAGTVALLTAAGAPTRRPAEDVDRVARGEDLDL